MTDHWLSDMPPIIRNHYGPADMPQVHPPIKPDWEPAQSPDARNFKLGDRTYYEAMEERFKAGGIQVFSGNAAWPLDMASSGIDLEDIAHALSMKVRYTGHCLEQYSIAQHSVHVMTLVPEEDRREALMHDASEYVLPDVAAPLKKTLEVRQWFKPIEDRVEAAIAKRFGLRHPFPPSVKAADNAMALFERTKIMAPTKHEWMVWTVPGEPAFIPDFRVWSWQEAKASFLIAAERYGVK